MNKVKKLAYRLMQIIACGLFLAGCTSPEAAATVAAKPPSPEGATRIPGTAPEKPIISTHTALSTPELIDAALARGEISPDQRLLYLTYAIYESKSLPEEFRSDVPWRGTLIVREIKQITGSKEICAVSLEVQREIRRLIPGSMSCLP